MLPELLFVIITLGVFALLAGRLFQSTVRLMHQTGAAQDAAASFDAAVQQLRGDAWSATREVQVDDPASAVVPMGTDRSVTWRIAGADLTRGDGKRTDCWTIPAGATFALDGSALVLRVPGGAATRGGEVRFVSQLAAVKGLRQ